jgi:hypothetical protein
MFCDDVDFLPADVESTAAGGDTSAGGNACSVGSMRSDDCDSLTVGVLALVGVWDATALV